MTAKQVLVFGAAGFIATYLIDELIAQGYEVTATDIDESGAAYYESRNIRYRSVDITKWQDFERLTGRRYDAVVHLAACQPANVALGQYDPKTYINVNVIGTLNVLDFSHKNQAGKIIYASSHRNTQALWSADKAISEDDGRGIRFSGEYAMFSIAESAAQDCVNHYQAQHGLKSLIFRLPPVYGYGPHTEIFMGGRPVKTGFQVFIDKAMACQPLELWGDCDVGRDIVYVKDVVAAFLKAIESPSASGLFNISSGKYLTLRAQAQTIARLFWGSDSKPEIVEVPQKRNDMEAFLYDITKAKRELNWSPRYSFEDMLIDYQLEMKSKRFEFLLDKRKLMLQPT